MMVEFRKNPPEKINGSPLVEAMDYLDDQCLAKANRKNGGIIIPRSDVLQFFTADGTKISIRPSGTEPKIKFYFGVKEAMPDVTDYKKVNDALDEKIKRIIVDLKLN
jgi:phosphoglucomutase